MAEPALAANDVDAQLAAAAASLKSLRRDAAGDAVATARSPGGATSISGPNPDGLFPDCDPNAPVCWAHLDQVLRAAAKGIAQHTREEIAPLIARIAELEARPSLQDAGV
jgi:hypothetical protein